MKMLSFKTLYPNISSASLQSSMRHFPSFNCELESGKEAQPIGSFPFNTFREELHVFAYNINSFIHFPATQPVKWGEFPPIHWIHG